MTQSWHPPASALWHPTAHLVTADSATVEEGGVGLQRDAQDVGKLQELGAGVGAEVGWGGVGRRR